jgi:hypothetical protein
MDAAEIRKIDWEPTGHGASQSVYEVLCMLREIAAQLAEWSAIQREIRDEQRQVAAAMHAQMGIPKVAPSPHKREQNG